VWPGNRPEVPVPRAPFPPACLLLIAVVAFVAPVRAQERPAPPVTAAPSAARPEAGSTTSGTAAPRVASILEFIRRRYDRPIAPVNQADEPLPAHLPSVHGLDGHSTPTAGALPLPLPPALWVDAVLSGTTAQDAVLDRLLRSRGPALLYYGLFSLDDETRSWIASERPLVGELAGRYAAPFVVAAPGLRVRGTRVQPPGGEAAREAWEALVGQRTDDAEGFTRALLERDDGRLAFFFGTMSQLTPAQLEVALQLDAPPAARVDTARRLRGVFDRVLLRWMVTNNVFWRPALDPALLLEELRTGADGRPVLPGTRGFWRAVLVNTRRAFTAAGAAASRDGDTVDFPWLAEQVFTGDRAADRRRFDVVLFVSRMAAHDPRWATPEAIGAIRAVQIYPALMLSLERATLVDLAAFTAAARRAEAIASIGDADRARLALVQFQGALALVTRAARASIPPKQLAAAVASLSSIELSKRGEYEGRLVSWVTAWLDAHLRDAPPLSVGLAAAGPLERAAITALAGRPERALRVVDWEGTRYRIDFPAAEARRLARHLGDNPRPHLSAAQQFTSTAAILSRDGLTAEALEEQARALQALAAGLGWDDPEGDAPGTYRGIRSTLARAVKRRDPRDVPRLAPALRRLADQCLGRGLMELAYAVALGRPERTTIHADEAAGRHSFNWPSAGGRASPWTLPSIAGMPGRPWHVSGALLGLDLALAEFSLVRTSVRQPLRKPTLTSDQRRVLVDTVALVEVTSLGDEDRTAILSTIRAGRARLAAARTVADALALADVVRLSPGRRTLLSWAVVSDREALPDMFSTSELLWLGLPDAAIPADWHRFGAPATPRTGCLCLQLPGRQPWESLTGRLHSGALASAFPDLNLRLAELLHELQMPAALLAPILGAATLDLVEGAAAKDADDRGALLDVVRALRRGRVEEYLALLTAADGPLVPVETGEHR
jgi:hypothetical protein